MKLLLASDIHRNSAACRDLAERAPGFDALVIAGDLATQRHGLDETITLLESITTPTIVVAGNAESPDELREACQAWPAATILHGEAAEVAGAVFFGIGGAVPPTPFGDWSYDLSEDEAARLAEPCPDGCILVTHAPPRDLADRSSQGVALGSTAIRALVDAKRPRLVVCGHIHDAAGTIVTAPNGTVVINAGPAGVEYEQPDP